jgi:MscS family membrane protein
MALTPVELQSLKHAGIHAVILIVLVLLINGGLRLLLNTVQRKKKKRQAFSWLKAFVEAVDAPLRLYLWIVVAAYAFYWIFSILFDHELLFFIRAELLATLAVMIWALIRLAINVESFYIAKVPKGQSASFEISGIKAVSRLVQVGIILLAALLILAILNVPISGLVTFGGVSGIAVAYAGKGILTNFFGGVIIYLNRQFSIGDLIASPDRSIEGYVERIDWRYTTIRTPNKQVLYIPNGIFIDIIVINRSRMSHRKIEQILNLRYEDILKVPMIFKELRAFLVGYDAIDGDAGISVHLTDFSNSSISFTISVYTFTVNSDEANVIQDIILMKAFEIMQKYEAASPVLAVLNK